MYVCVFLSLYTHDCVCMYLNEYVCVCMCARLRRTKSTKRQWAHLTPDRQEKERKFVEGSIHREQSLFLEGAVLIFGGGATAFQTNFLNIWRDFTCLICIQRVVLRLRQRLLWHVLDSLVAWQTARKDKYKRLREKSQWQGALLIFGGGSPYVECLQTAGETQTESSSARCRTCRHDILAI